MCGIARYIGDFIPGLLARMNAVQAHRGPDGQGVFEDSEVTVALGHVRLSILDLTPAAAQPMCSPDRRIALICKVKPTIGVPRIWGGHWPTFG